MADVAIYSTPDKLYRYRSTANGNLDRELKAIEENYIYCPNLSSMNDPMEGAHEESRILQSIEKYKHYSTEVKEYLDKSGIASLSETNKSEPMWAYYAGHFTGICIEYGLARLANNLPGNIAIVRMQYSENPPILRANRETAEDRARMALSSKTLRWQAEREWRILRPEVGKASYGDSVKVVTRVYVGARMLDRDASIVVDRMQKLGISVYMMKIDKYALEFAKMHKHKTGTRAADILEKVRGGTVTR